jgi:hypothetical protein
MPPPESKYPYIQIKLSDLEREKEEGYFHYAIMYGVLKALRQAGVPAAEVDAFINECMAGSYYDLLLTCCRWVYIEPPPKFWPGDHVVVPPD